MNHTKCECLKCKQQHLALLLFNLDHFAGWARACRLGSAAMVAVLDNRLPAIVLIDRSCNLRQFACHAMKVDAVPVAEDSACSKVSRENQLQSPDKIPAKTDWTLHSDSVEDPVQTMCFASLNSIRLLGLLFGEMFPSILAYFLHYNCAFIQWQQKCEWMTNTLTLILFHFLELFARSAGETAFWWGTIVICVRTQSHRQ